MLNWLERAIAAGEIPRGGEIPSERALAKLLGVAKNTAAAAVDEAEASGLVLRRAGTRKRYVGEVRGGSLASSTIYVLAALPSFSDIATAPGWSDEFLALDVLRHISRAGRLVSLVNTISLPQGGLDTVFAARPGGMVVTNGVNADPIAMEALRRCREGGIPAVAYGNAPELRGFDRAYSDHRSGSRELTRWLLSRGCRRIVPFFPFAPERFWERERIEGYSEAMREAGLEPLPCVAFGSRDIGLAQTAETFRLNAALALSALMALRRRGVGPDALLCRCDDWTKPVIAAIRDLGLVPNRDIIVAGYDNMDAKGGFAEFEADRPAVTVDKRNGRSAEDIAGLILARMAGTLPPEPQIRMHSNELIVLENL
ncbi:MAG: substrate-binding domain-containing protein [Kiritimatiellae bacterium]|nr:substrate-binding domain-containing protein [Kiritimatiellia bacterium]